jgi:hypothetical protein
LLLQDPLIRSRMNSEVQAFCPQQDHSIAASVFPKTGYMLEMSPESVKVSSCIHVPLESIQKVAHMTAAVLPRSGALDAALQPSTSAGRLNKVPYSHLAQVQAVHASPHALEGDSRRQEPLA